MELERFSIKANEPIALILSPRLGDSLFLMNVAHNLRRAGRRVVVMGTHAQALAGWFPGFDIRPLPAECDIAELAGYGAIVQMDEDVPIAGLGARYPQFAAIRPWALRIGTSHLDKSLPNGIMSTFCAFTRHMFGVDDWVVDSGLRVPQGCRARLRQRRVILHPTSSEASRCWTPGQYAALAGTLRERGYDPLFVLAPYEREDWRPLLSSRGLPILDAPDLASTAKAIHESGWFIGTDSGIGHLASACGVPTVTIADRVRNMQSWRPVWAAGLVVRPWWLPLRSLRRKYWREATTVSKVLGTFKRLQKRVDGTGLGPQAGRSVIQARSIELEGAD